MRAFGIDISKEGSCSIESRERKLFVDGPRFVDEPIIVGMTGRAVRALNAFYLPVAEIEETRREYFTEQGWAEIERIHRDHFSGKYSLLDKLLCRKGYDQASFKGVSNIAGLIKSSTGLDSKVEFAQTPGSGNWYRLVVLYEGEQLNIFGHSMDGIAYHGLTIEPRSALAMQFAEQIVTYVNECIENQEKSRATSCHLPDPSRPRY